MSDEATGSQKVRGPETIDMLGARLSVVARMGEGDDDTVLIRSTMDSDRSVPLHAHADVECFYVLSGRVEVFLDDAAPGWRAIEAGQSLLIPGSVRHAVRNISGAPVDAILATTVRIARFFHEIGRPTTSARQLAPTPEDIAHVHRTAKAYGYWMATPAESQAVTGQG